MNGFLPIFLEVLYSSNDKSLLSSINDLMVDFINKSKQATYYYYYKDLPIPGTVEGNKLYPFDFAFSYDEASKFLKNCSDLSNNFPLFKEFYNNCDRFSNSRHKKLQRLRPRVEKLFKSSPFVYFITYTFSDEDLKLKSETRRKNVIHFFKSLHGVFLFILNIDFGEKNGREHYHCLLSSYNEIEYKYFPNNIDFERVPNFIEDKERISRYILKVENHALKSSTKGKRLFYYGFK